MTSRVGPRKREEGAQDPSGEVVAMTDNATPDALDDDEAFAALFDERIAPHLQRFETQRQSAARVYAIALGVAGVLAAVLGGFALLGADGAGPFALFGAALVIIVALGIAEARMQPVRRGAKSALIEPLAASLGVSYAPDPPTSVGLSDFRERRLIGGYDTARRYDHFEGVLHGSPFSLFQATLKRRRRDSKGRSRTVTVFSGQLIRIGFPRRFHGVTVILRDAGMFNWMLGAGSELKRVGLVDPRFEKTFEVFGSDQVEARYLLTPTFMERLLRLEAIFEGGRSRAAFARGELLIAVQGGDLFKPGSMFRPLADRERALKVRADLLAIRALIDALLAADQDRAEG